MKILDKQNYHFIGIGGIGISAIARMLLLQGKKVSGSDSAKSEITDDLENLGVRIFIGQKPENIERDTEVVIYTIAIHENNPELEEAKKRKIPCFSYPETLGELSKKMQTITISGTHGKTTTTAMIAHILEKSGLDPTIIVGSKMLGEQKSNFKGGKSQYLVVEACEYRRSFLNLYPQILVITNIEKDHLDYYKDLSDIQSAFKELAERVPETGFIITDTESENIKPVIKNVSAKVLNYKEIDDRIELLIPGKHNVLNAKTAIQTVKTIEIEEEKARETLKNFYGTWRRLEYKGEKNNIIFYDDYAHHPTEVRASLEALKERYGDRKIICVFEPHQQGRTREFFDDFINSLKIADEVFIAPIFITREKDDGVTTNHYLAKELSQYTKSKSVENTKELEEYIKNIEEPSCLVMMGAGDIYKWTKDLLPT